MKLQSALDLAAKGFRIFPIAVNSKKPASGLKWKEEATTDPARVEAWWTENPEYNIGVACGKGLLVVDADISKGRPGLDSLSLLDMLGLPVSHRVGTPSGGAHIYLRTANAHGNRVDTIPDYPGIDIRCEDGYVLGPGSTIEGKPYVLENPDAGIPVSPSWFEDILLAHRPQHTPSSAEPLVDLDRPEAMAKATHWLTHNAPEAIDGAGGDETTYRVAARCRDFGLSQDATLSLMLEHWNERQSPPWQPDDLAVKVHNAFNYATGGWGSQSAAAEFDAIEIDMGEPPFSEAVTAAKAHGEKAPRVVRASVFAPLEKPIRQFLVQDLIPHRNVTTLNGDGATGKSLLAMQLGIAVATGARWLGQSVLKPGPVLYFSAEDDEDETHIRIKEICAAERLDPEDLENLHIALMAGEDALLAVENGSQGAVLVRTKMFKRLHTWLASIRPTLLILDNLADIFGGNENVKALARQFIGMLRGLALEFDCAVLLLAHPSLSGMASGSGSSGNVAWNNSVRSRLYLQRDKDEDGSEARPNRRVLEVKKANYASTETVIEMDWERGRFVALDAPDMSALGDMEVVAEDRAARARRVFLEILDKMIRTKRIVSASLGANYAPKLFAGFANSSGVKKHEFEIAMESLLDDGTLTVEITGPASRQQRSLVFARGIP